MKNREWLNNLTNEEMADFLSNTGCGFCIHEYDLECEPPVYCYDGILQWLEQEREEKQVYAVMKSDYVHNPTKEVISTEVIATEGIFFDKKEAEEHAKTLGKGYKVFKIE